LSPVSALAGPIAISPIRIGGAGSGCLQPRRSAGHRWLCALRLLTLRSAEATETAQALLGVQPSHVCSLQLGSSPAHELAPQHVLACAAQPRRLPQYGPTAPAHSRPSRRYCSVECQRMHWFHGDHARKCSHENPASAASTDAQRDHYTAAKAELLRVPAAAPAKVAASTAAVPPHQARDGHDQPLSLPHMQQVHVERAVRTAPGPRQAVTAPHRCCLALCTCARLAVYSCPTPSLLKTAVVIAFGIDFHARMYLRSAARSTTADYNHSGSRQMGAS
jgi:hypothetical protein